ncbi:MAG: GAF domain-containing protein [Armatimonadota bacterium]
MNEAKFCVLSDVSKIIVTLDSIDEVLQYILEEGMRLVNGDRGFLAIADHDRGELDVRYTAGKIWTEEKRLKRLKVSEETGKGITSQVAATGKAYRTGNVLEDPYYMRFFDDVRSEVAVPLVDGCNRTRGVINIESTEENAFDDMDEAVLIGLADLATLEISISDHRAREAALIQIGKQLGDFSETRIILQKVIDVAADALKFEDCSLFILDQVTGKLVLRASRGPLSKKIGEAAYHFGDGLTGWVAENQKAVRIIDPPSDPRWKGRYEELPSSDVAAFMAVPILNREGVVGVLRVQRKKSPYKWFPVDFTEDDERILSAIAAQLGIALDNARLVDKLLSTERMAAWGEMSARSAHMIGNRVFAIKGDINELEYLLKNKPCEANETLKLCDSVKNGIFLLEEILDEFREFMKATQLNKEEIDICSLVKESIDEGFPRRSDIKLELNLNDCSQKIMADPKKLKRAFTELMENSANFMPDGGIIKIKAETVTELSQPLLSRAHRSGTYIQLKFEDTGPGVELEDKPKIFAPFFTLRAKGMGLGLSIVKGIIEAHQGLIFETGIPGKGACFVILLPCEIS